MRTVIQFVPREELKALDILLRHSPGMILPDRRYVVSVEAAEALRRSGVKFRMLASEANAPVFERVLLLNEPSAPRRDSQSTQGHPHDGSYEQTQR
jgi:hypothetical protein